MPNLKTVKIFPAIGIARIGNSPEWYVGPELPFPAPPPPPPGGTYKDANCRIKRQAQRFRLWGFFSNNTDRELTVADGDITWTVHLVNRKPSTNGEGIIDGGLQTLYGTATTASFQGTVGGVTRHSGASEATATARLSAGGGLAKEESPRPPASHPTSAARP